MDIGMHAGQDSTTSQYDTFTTWLGRQCYTRNTFAGYTSWSAIASPSFLNSATMPWLKRGSQYQEVLAIAMCPQPGSVSSSGVTLGQVAGGAGDTYFTQLGQNIATACTNNGVSQRQIIIRLGWEMNGDWYQWGYGANNKSWNPLSSFIAAWRRIVPLIRNGAPNVRIMWCPTTGRNIDPNNSNGYIASGSSQNYPGDDVVDIVALDVYDQYNNGWLSILNGGSGVIVGGLTALRNWAIAHGKPEAYPEWACQNTVNGYQDHPLFIAGMYCWFQEAVAAGSSLAAQCYWNTSSGGPNSAVQGASVPVITGSISGNVLTVTNMPSQGLLSQYHTLLTANPSTNVGIQLGTTVTALHTSTNGLTGTGGTGTYNVSISQTVPSQQIQVVPVPQSAQMYKTLFGKLPAVSKIPGVMQNGVFGPSTPAPAHYAMVCDGTNFHYALK